MSGQVSTMIRCYTDIVDGRLRTHCFYTDGRLWYVRKVNDRWVIWPPRKVDPAEVFIRFPAGYRPRAWHRPDYISPSKPERSVR